MAYKSRYIWLENNSLNIFSNEEWVNDSKIYYSYYWKLIILCKSKKRERDVDCLNVIAGLGVQRSDVHPSKHNRPCIYYLRVLQDAAWDKDQQCGSKVYPRKSRTRRRSTIRRDCSHRLSLLGAYYHRQIDRPYRYVRRHVKDAMVHLISVFLLLNLTTTRCVPNERQTKPMSLILHSLQTTEITESASLVI